MSKMVRNICNTIRILHFKINGIVISMNCHVDNHSTFEGNNSVGEGSVVQDSEFGKGTYIGCNCFIAGTKIGRFCSIGNFVRTIIGNHPTSQYVSTYPAFFRNSFNGYSFMCGSKFNEKTYVDDENLWCCLVGNDVWIGDSVSILNGVRIGDGAIIAAGAVVVKDVPPYSIVGGVPARTIKYRFNKDVIKWLENFRWWERSEQWLEKNAKHFDNVEEFMNNRDEK